MRLRTKQEHGVIYLRGHEYSVQNHTLELPKELAYQAIVAGQYVPYSKYDRLNEKCKNLLLIRGSGLGDVLMCQALRRHILQKFPKLEIDFAASGEYDGLLIGDQWAKNIFNYNHMLSENYDCAVNLNQIEFSAKFKDLHKIDLFSEYMGLGKVHCKRLFYTPTDAEIEWAKKIVPENSVCLVLRSTCNSKHFTVSSVKSLVVKLILQHYNVLLLDRDERYAQQFCGIHRTKVVNLSGKYRIREYAAIMKVSKGVITPDTGFMHLANAMWIPTVAYFGSIGHQIAITPGNIDIMTPAMTCYPCNNFGCPVASEALCLKSLNLDQLVQMAHEKFR